MKDQRKLTAAELVRLLSKSDLSRGATEQDVLAAMLLDEHHDSSAPVLLGKE